MGETKKIVIEHYPVERLPEELRRGLEAGQSVRVTVEQPTEDAPTPRPSPPLSSYFGKLERVHADPVEDIRKLRDEWE